jgi:hypothetical protein
MDARWIWTTTAALSLLIGGCAKMGGGEKAASEKTPSGKSEATEKPEPGEVKVALDKTPAPVQKTIQKELVGGELEDIAKKTMDGKTVYETDIIRKDGKWEVIVAEDGSIVSKLKEGGAEEKAIDAKEAQSAAFRESFDVDKSRLAATGNNPYLSIQPGRVLKLKSGIDALTVSILPQTMTIDGVKCGVLEERETKDGKLIEVSRNFFATDPATGDVYYFGEDVDNYKDGQIVDHESAWHAGEKGAKFGLMIPGKPAQGDRFYQEIAPKVAMDRVEIVSTDETLKTPAGTFEHCLHLKETTPLEGDVSHKWYAPGVGIIKDDEFELAEKP